MRIKTRLLLFLVPAIFLTLAALTLFSYWTSSKQADRLADAHAASIAAEQSDLIFDKIGQAEANVISLVSVLQDMRQSDDRSRKVFSRVVRGFAASFEDYFGVWVLWEPNAFDGNDDAFVNDTQYGNKEGRANAYWLRDEGELIYDPSDDYDHEEYYSAPMKKGRLFLTAPYRDMDTPDKVLMSTVAMPIMENGRPLGVAGIDLGMDFIQGLVDDVKPYGTGYAMLISDSGSIIAQPGGNSSKSENLPSVPESVLRSIKTGQAFSLTGNSVINGEKVKFLYTPVKMASFEAPWYFMLALPEQKIMAESRMALYTQLAISLVALIVLGGLVFYTASGVSKPLRRIVTYAHSVAAGDYGAKVDRRGFVLELVELQTALRSMVEALLASMAQAEQRNDEARQEAERARKAMDAAEQARQASEENRKAMLEVAKRVNIVAEKLQMTSEELSAKIESAGRETLQQNELMGETVNAISGMADSIARVSQNADGTAQFTERTREQAQEGAKVMNRTLEAFDSIKRETESLADQIKDLAVRSEAISSILGVINDIADQTNLLALNAAIEAARAGEAGRGFAVVADEVRKLAEKTVDATKQVSEAISGIRGSMEVSAQGVARTAETVNGTVELGHNAQGALSEIVTLVEKMNEQIHDIAKHCNEQAATSEGVSAIVDKLRLLSAGVSEAMDEGASIARTLEPEANELAQLVEQLTKDS